MTTEQTTCGDERDAYEWAVRNQDYQGSFADWLAMPASERAEYDLGAAGIGTV